MRYHLAGWLTRGNIPSTWCRPSMRHSEVWVSHPDKYDPGGISSLMAMQNVIHSMIAYNTTLSRLNNPTQGGISSGWRQIHYVISVIRLPLSHLHEIAGISNFHDSRWPSITSIRMPYFRSTNTNSIQNSKLQMLNIFALSLSTMRCQLRLLSFL